MMIRFVIQNRKRSVDLFQQKRPNHLVSKCHPGKRQQLAAAPESLAQSVGAADCEYHLTHPGVPLFTDERRQPGGIHLLASFIQQNEGHIGGDLLLQTLTFPATHLFRPGTLLIAYINQLKRAIASDAAGVFVNRFLDPKITTFADPQYLDFQKSVSLQAAFISAGSSNSGAMLHRPSRS